MAKLVILGSAHAVASAEQGNTHFYIQAGHRHILVDCGNNPMQVLPVNGIQPNVITDILITHFHPDHVSSLPLFLMDLWLLGRQTPMELYANAHALSRIERMLDLFDWKRWPNFYTVNFHEIQDKEMVRVLADSEIEIFSSPVKHLIPTLGLRVVFLPQQKVIAYSCDTEPCPAVVDLAQNANLLIHETSGALKGHTSAAQAAQIAAAADVEKLLYIHYPTDDGLTASMLSDGKKFFSGQIDLARDRQQFEF